MHTCKVQINIVAMLSLAKQRHQAKVFEMHEELQASANLLTMFHHPTNIICHKEYRQISLV
jgi:hypothetical protein